MEVKNDIAVKFALYSEDLKYEAMCGSIVLYNHTDLYTGSDKKLVFTGARFEYSDKAKMVCESPEGNILKHFLIGGYVCVYGSTAKLNKIVCDVYFIPKEQDTVVEYFYAHFLKLT